MRQLSELTHEYTAMGVLGPIQLIGRRRGEYPLVQDTVTCIYKKPDAIQQVHMIWRRTRLAMLKTIYAPDSLPLKPGSGATEGVLD